MTEDQKEKARADMERSAEKMRAALVEVCTIAADALKAAREAETVGMKWGTYSAAIGKIHGMTRFGWQRLVETGGGATYHTPPEALDAVMGNPPFDPATGTGALPRSTPINPNARNMIGIRCAPSAIIAWNFQDIHIVCDARKIDEGHWKITGRANGEERISAVVTGGRWTANCYLRAIRNGMTSRARRVKGLHMKAAEATNKETSNEH